MSERLESRADLPDPALDYALAVLEGRVVAGPHVIAACERFMRDLLDAEEKGWFYDREAALDPMLFFAEELTVRVGDEDVPFLLMDFQAFIVGNIFGWRWRDTGHRRFRAAYVECGKGSGKSPLAGGIGLYMGLEDGEKDPEIYAAGSKKEQAKILFNDAVAMLQASPGLKKRALVMGGNEPRKIKFGQGGVFEPVASDKKKSGPRVHCGLVDELHEHQDRYTIDMLQDGFKGRNQPLLFVITNSGFDRTSICWEWHEFAIKVAHGEAEDDTLFSMVFSLHPEDDPLEDESCWPKTNPGIGRTITEAYLRKQVADARVLPGRESVVRRLNFCEWTDAENPWITRQVWATAERDLGHYEKGKLILPGFEGARCTVALDLSFAFDLTAMALDFPEADRHLLAIEYFTPRETAKEREKRDSVPYMKWIKEGYIHGVPAKTVRMEFIAQRLLEILQLYDVEWVTYDRYAHKELAERMQELGVTAPWVEHPQGFRRGGSLEVNGVPILDNEGKKVDNPLWMPQSVNQFEEALIESRIEVQRSPVSRWQVSSVVIREDPAGTGNRIFDKRKSTGRIDGIVAGAMAIGGALAPKPDNMPLESFLRNPVIAR